METCNVKIKTQNKTNILKDGGEDKQKEYPTSVPSSVCIDITSVGYCLQCMSLFYKSLYMLVFFYILISAFLHVF